MTMVATLTGIFVEPGKDVDEAVAMVVLGMSVRLLVVESRILVQLNEEKAAQWILDKSGLCV